MQFTLDDQSYRVLNDDTWSLSILCLLFLFADWIKVTPTQQKNEPGTDGNWWTANTERPFMHHISCSNIDFICEINVVSLYFICESITQFLQRGFLSTGEILIPPVCPP